MRQTWAFVFRGYHLTRRYISWVIVFDFYALVTSATVVSNRRRRARHAFDPDAGCGRSARNFLSSLYKIAMSIAYERWEGTSSTHSWRRIAAGPPVRRQHFRC